MKKLTAIALIAVALAGCSTTGKYYDVAAGVDAYGNVIWERERIAPTIMETSNESLSDPCLAIKQFCK